MRHPRNDFLHVGHRICDGSNKPDVSNGSGHGPYRDRECLFLLSAGNGGVPDCDDVPGECLSPVFPYNDWPCDCDEHCCETADELWAPGNRATHLILTNRFAIWECSIGALCDSRSRWA